MTRLLQLASLFVLVAVGATLLAYPHLPDPMPIHFDLRGRPDGYGALPWAALFMPLTMVGLTIVLAISRWRIERQRGDSAARVLDMFALVTLAFVLELHVVMLRYATGVSLDVARITLGSVGLFFAITGNAYGKLPRNHVVGIRVPRTMNDDETWLMTHRFGGRVMVIGGMLVASAALCGAPATLLVFAILSIVLLPIVYAYTFRGDAR